jgi:DNA-directed RNA polymerase
MSILAGTQYDEQIRLEQDAIQAGKDRYWKNVSDATKRGDGCDLPVARIFTDAWMPTVTQAFAAFIAQCRSGEMFKGATYCVPVYYNADANECATIFLRTVFSLLLRGEVVAKSGRPAIRMDRLADTLGKNITAQVLQSQFGESWRDDELALRRKKEQMGEEWDWTADEDFQHLRILMTNRKLAYPKRVLQCVRKLELSPDMNLVPRAFMNVGAAAINVAMPMLVVMDEDTPYQAFVESRTRISSFTGRARRVMELTPEASRIIDEAHAARAVLRPIYEPMVMTPFAWVDAMEEGSSIVQGGYIKIRTPLVAKPHPIQKRMIREADMTKVFRGIDACASQPWMVNERILRIQQELLRTGEEIGSLPSLYPKTRPMRPDAAETNKKIHRAWKRSCIEWEVHRIGHLGVIQQVASTHAMCEKMLGRRFYLPHMLDFRGRCFPVPPMLNHHGDDARRSLMLMASDKPMTNDGRYWLMVHAANMYGVDDVPIAERAKWTEDNASNITRACSDPHSDEFWKRAAEPFQFLAACYGLMDDEVGRYIPCQRDGTMNGLQHYAAMARDADAAGAANLRPSDRKHKVYKDVLDYTIRTLTTQYADNPDVQAVMPWIVKDVVKQPVMTEMYGVTQYGARKQVYDNLQKQGCPKDLAKKVRGLVASIVAKADIPYLQPARQIMAWIASCADIITKTGQPMTWTTPIGFPVLQPYNKSTSLCATVIGEFRVDDRTKITPKPKQVSACAPNLIHSFDACHFLMAATQAASQGLSFAGVFDSFWSQPADAAEVGDVVLDTFVKFHEEHPLLQVREQWVARFGDAIPLAPDHGDWDLNEVRSSQFAFS